MLTAYLRHRPPVLHSFQYPQYLPLTKLRSLHSQPPFKLFYQPETPVFTGTILRDPYTVVAKEAEKEIEKEIKEQHDALALFIAKNYKGWVLTGTSSEFGACDRFSSPCELHLTKQNETKVVRVNFREFQRPDGTTYWLAYELRPIDLLLRKLESERDAGRELERIEIEKELEEARAISEEESIGY
jgi:hypothetical protein